MKVLYILHTTTWDGSAHSLLNMIHSVKSDVEPIILFRKKCKVYEYYRQEGLKCLFLPFVNNKKKAYGENVLIYIIKVIRYFIFNLFSILCLYFLLKKENIEIIHTNSGVTDIGFYLAKILKAKHVIHLREFQDIDFGIAPLMGWKKFYKNLEKADARIAITKAVYNHFHLENYKNSFQLFNAVLPAKSTINFEKKKYFVFCCAALSETKGIDFCLEAFGLSSLYKNGYKLIVIGENSNGKLHKKLDSILDKYEIKDFVSFVGAVKDIKVYFSQAKAFLMCSKNEGFGRVTAEAMFYGCPVIARNSGGTPEFIENGRTGFIFNNLEECSYLMQKVVSEDLSELQKNAQQYAVKNFSEESYGTKLLNIYKEII